MSVETKLVGICWTPKLWTKIQQIWFSPTFFLCFETSVVAPEFTHDGIHSLERELGLSGEVHPFPNQGKYYFRKQHLSKTCLIWISGVLFTHYNALKGWKWWCCRHCCNLIDHLDRFIQGHKSSMESDLRE